MEIIEVMEQVRTEYPLNWSNADRGEYLNEVAWVLKQQGLWPLVGLLAKDGGNVCPNPAGVACSCDYLVDRETLNGYDVLVDEVDPTWPGFDHPSDNFSSTPTRWVAPEYPGGTPSPIPVPEPPPQPIPEPNIEPRVLALENLFQEILHQLTLINETIDSLAAPREVFGQTGRTWGHSHPVQLAVMSSEEV